jgi:antitoxin component YwqK of YwqJK toxin-antitoxin module
MAELKRTYYPNGDLATEVFEINGKREGVFKSYHINITNITELYNKIDTTNSPKHISCICYYFDGKINGEYITYHYNGDLCCICNYVDGKIEGEWKKYYSSGQLETIGNYIDGKQDGQFITYNDNSSELCRDKDSYTIKDISNYVNGEKVLNSLFN